MSSTTEIERLNPPVAVLWAAGAVVGAIVLYVSLVGGPQARAIVDQQRTEDIASETRAICQKLGMRIDAQSHAVCRQALDEVRANQDRRRADESGSVP